MSSPISIPEQTSSESTNDSKPQGTPTTDSSEIRHPLESAYYRCTPRLPPDQSMEEMRNASFAKVAINPALRELWFLVMDTPIPGHPDVKPGRKYNRQNSDSEKNVVDPTSVTERAVACLDVKDSESASSA
ncbi:hypothetical protein M413DRAFT_423837 [Hebeloma cylindrosporum]|uniref:Uncharacterized protein n=1 Tax=Hebeloma cylindrosporum TaxID=76867 RepID=A0A0C2Y7L8_HEBCY|nr:hypothetical protein M413DRAFT_423837 [Hebeloma cylindrosporum h7]